MELKDPEVLLDTHTQLRPIPTFLGSHTILTPTVQIRKLGHREVKNLPKTTQQGNGRTKTQTPKHEFFPRDESAHGDL